MSFDLEFSSFWVSRLFDLGDLGDLKKSPVNVFKNYIFEIIGFYWSKCNVECAIRLTLISKSAKARGDLSELIQKTQFAMIDPVVIELQKVRLSLDKIGFRIT